MYFVASLDSTAQTGNANSGDWQEDVYQKVQYRDPVDPSNIIPR